MDFLTSLIKYATLLLWMVLTSQAYFMNWVPADVQASSGLSSRHKRMVTSNDNFLWDKGIIPYKFSDNLPEWRRNEYLEFTFPTYSNYSCITLVPWTETVKADYGLNHGNYLIFDVKGSKCESSVGNVKNSGQPIYGCTWRSCVHEIGHALGFVHEQHSELRDEFVRINFDNVRDGLEFAFETRLGYMTYDIYDYDSIMHYAQKAFSTNKLKTIDVLDENFRPFPDHVDREAYFYFFYEVNKRYQCADHCSVTCHNGGYKASLNGKCGCRCPEGLDPSTNCETLLNQDCGGIIYLDDSNPTFTFTSPTLVNANNNVTCHWFFNGPEDSKLLLDFPTFNVRKSEDTCVDEVAVKYYLPGAYGAQFCGDSFKKSLQSYRHQIVIGFTQTELGSGSSSFEGSVTMVRDESFCYNMANKGHNYDGAVSNTDTFRPCLNWDEVEHCKHNVFNPHDFGANLEGNLCRNPDGGNRPWCYTESDLCLRSYCDACQLGVCKDIFTNCDAEIAAQPSYCDTDPAATRGCRASCGLCQDFTPLPTVPEITCSKPTLPNDAAARSLNKKYALGETVDVTCGTDNSVAKTITCLSSGNWTNLSFVCGTCADGWVMFKDRCYKIFKDKIKRHNAISSCAAAHAGGTLFTDHDSEVHDFITQRFESESGAMSLVWMGMDKDSGNYIWTSGTRELTWTTWAVGYPTSNAHKCVMMTVDRMWKDKSCLSKAGYICEYTRGEPTVCQDQRPDCAELLRRNPDMCDHHRHSFATDRCPYTCSICGNAAAQVKCTDEGTNKNSDPSATIVSPGEHISYTCRTGYYLVTGNLLRACTVTGQLTGSPPQCLGETKIDLPVNGLIRCFTRKEGMLKYDWPVNTLTIRDRDMTGKPGTVYLADNDYMRVPHKGKIFKWSFFSKFDGQVALQAWRKVSDNTYELMGENVITSTMDDRVREITIPDDGSRIWVLEGDLIGVYYSNANRGGVAFDECVGDSSALNQLQANATGGFQVGSTYSMDLYANKCRLFSINAMIDSR